MTREGLQFNPQPEGGQLYLAGSVEILLFLRQVVEGEEGVAIARRAVADAVALAKQTSLPDDLAALHCILQILILLKHLGGGGGGG